MLQVYRAAAATHRRRRGASGGNEGGGGASILSGLAYGAGYQDDFSSYATINDWAADSRYQNGFPQNFALVDAGDGGQALRILGQAGGYSLGLPDAPDGVTNLWARWLFRLAPGGLGPNAGEVANITYSWGAGIYFDFNADGTTRVLRTTGAGTPDWTPGLIQYDDGSFWEIAAHLDNTDVTNFEVGLFIQKADHSGVQYTDTVIANADGWAVAPVSWLIRAPSEPSLPWLDLRAWEWVDGSAHADPFGVL